MELDKTLVLDDMRNYLSEEFAMDSDEIAEMVGFFLESLSEIASNAKTAMDAGDFTALAAAGHSLKGAAANIGAKQISAIGAALDTAAKAGDESTCAAKTAEIEEAAKIMTGDAS